MFAALLPLAGSLLTHIVGGHLFGAHLLSGSLSTALKLVTGLGWRFMFGLLAALYFENEGVRHAVNAVGEAVVKVVI